MRRESSTVVALVGEVGDGLLAGLQRSPNVAVVSPPTAADHGEQAESGWELGAEARRDAARRRATYVVVAADPLADVAAGWRAMWDLSGDSPGPAAFEASAAAGGLGEPHQGDDREL
jgi:hypothetical protein